MLSPLLFTEMMLTYDQHYISKYGTSIDLKLYQLKICEIWGFTVLLLKICQITVAGQVVSVFQRTVVPLSVG